VIPTRTDLILDHVFSILYPYRSLTFCLVSLLQTQTLSLHMNTLLFSNVALFIMYVLVSEDLMEPILLLRVTDATSFPFLIPNICIVNITKGVRYSL